MGKDTSKADYIRRLYARTDLTVNQIADAAECSDAYVRVCARQRGGGELSKADKAYMAKPGVKAGIAAYRQTLFAAGDRQAARAAWREVYYEWRYNRGLAPKQAAAKAAVAYTKTRHRTASPQGRARAILAARRVRQDLQELSGDNGQHQDIQRL